MVSMVLCIRPNLAIGIHRGTLAYIRWVIHTLGHTIRVCEGGERPGKGDKVVGMQLHVYVHRAMCMCEICRSYTCRLF